ncbi:MAG: chaperone modulator CbpM [Desulfatiglandaceae bacterium]
MEREFWTMTEALEFFEVEESFLFELEGEEIICPRCFQGSDMKHLSIEEMEKVRIAKVLCEEMGVNLSGVQVILHMRQQMMEMRRQFDVILEDLRDRFLELHSGS